jgi:hypothetical protein
MPSSHEDEIYSIMFSSLKHPVRRKILRMLGNKPMTFMEMVEELGVSSPNLTYHLESLGELISKMENDQYKLSSFGVATVGAMKGIEEVKTEPKRSSGTFKWKVFSGALMVSIILLASFAAIQFNNVNDLTIKQNSLSADIQRLQSYGAGADKVLNFFKNVTKIDTSVYSVAMDANNIVWRTDFGGMAEENMKYTLQDSYLNKITVDLRFRNNHFSRYDLHMTESTPTFVQPQPMDVLQNAKFTLARYRDYAGDNYINQMIKQLETITKIENNQEVIEGNLKLQIFSDSGTVLFAWMYTENGIDYQTKGLQMIFQNNILTTMTDGYFLYSVGNTNLAVSREQAIELAKNYVKTLTYNLEGQQVSGFTVADEPLSVQLVPHTRGNSVALFPYWYIELKLNQIYAGGRNVITVGIYADTQQIADVQMLSTSAGTET